MIVRLIMYILLSSSIIYAQEITTQNKTNNIFMIELISIFIIMIFFILWRNYKLKRRIISQEEELEVKVEERMEELKKQKEEFEKIYNGTKDALAIMDMKSNFLQVNPSYCEMTGYTEEELLSTSCFNLTVDEDKEASSEAVQEIIRVGYIKNFEKSCIVKGSKIINTSMSMSLLENPQRILISVRDITQEKQMEKEINNRTKELEAEKRLISSIINSQDSIVVTSDGKTLQTVNKAFMEFYGLNSTKEFELKYGPCICDSFEDDVPSDYVRKFMGDELWIQYILNRPDEKFKVIIKKEDKPYIFLISLDSFVFENKKFVTVVLNNITDLEESKKKIEVIHKHTRDSIEYASLIQGAVVSSQKDIMPYFKDSFVYWMPKDTVGGDIWLFNELRHKDECLLLFIDCTGHGVPGAFVTMIVKAIEREIVSSLKKHHEYDISPAVIMSHFNKTMKILLKQETKDSISNAGWDGGIIYYNRRTQILKFAGAETPLFYTMPDGEFKTVKGNRYSVGYKKCDMDYEYKETIIEVQEGMKFYCTTDGFLDQNGGEKDFPFGKKRFGNIIKENYNLSMDKQKDIFINQMTQYEMMIPNNERNDDMTLIGFEIGERSDFIEDTIEEIVKYEGVMTQNVIATCMDNIKSKIDNIGLMSNISTITIECCQNMMNYSKNDIIDSRQIVPAGTIIVQYINNSYYNIMAINIVSKDDKAKIEPKLIEIQSLDRAGIKKRYRELRKSGQNTHSKGGGIGIYEIAKISNDIEYSFDKINSDKYYFSLTIKVKKDK